MAHRMNKNEALRKDAKDGFYWEFDEDFEMYGVFGLETGFCYSQHYTKREAKDAVSKMEKWKTDAD